MSCNIIKKQNTSKDIEQIEIPQVNYIPKKNYNISDIVLKTDEEENYNIELLKKEAVEIALKEIESEREKLIEKSKLEAIKIKKEIIDKAYEEGFKKGYEDGVKKYNKEYLNLKNNLIDKYKDAEDYVIKYFKENENRIIDLAIDMAESIVNYSLSNEEDNIIKLVTPILREFEGPKNIIILANKENIKILEKYKSDLESKSQNSKLILIEDKTLNDHDIKIETDYQIIDLGIKNQLEAIRNKIRHME